MKNMLLESVEYRIEQTALGTWRSFLYPTGMLYREFTSHMAILGLPLFQYTRGICPETGRRKVATGVIAVGKSARGVLAVGQSAYGLMALGQTCVGVVAVGQLAIGLCLGLGQLATGYVAIGQLALGSYVLAQVGLGSHVWSMTSTSPEAKEFFQSLRSWLHIR